jgi:sulfur-oxidizing protein SoxY
MRFDFLRGFAQKGSMTTPRTRRQVLTIGAAGAAMAAVGRNAAATPQEAAAAIAKFTGGSRAERGRITIDLPEIAENGNTVPLSIVVDSPMTADDHVTDILVVAEKNPFPGVVAFHLTPASGRAEIATRIRLAATEDVTVVAKTSKGKVFTEQKAVKVTVGGCGG